MIESSCFCIHGYGVFSASQVAELGERFGIEYRNPGCIEVGDDDFFEGETAVDNALALLERANGVLAAIGVEKLTLTLAFYYVDQCAFGFDRSQLAQLSSYADVLAIDCYERSQCPSDEAD